MDVTIAEQEPLRVQAVRHHGRASRIPDAWAALWRIVGERGLIADITNAVGVSAGPPDARGVIDYHAALIFPRAAPPIPGLETIDLPGGRYAVYRYVGPYSGLPGAYERLFGDWLPSSDVALDGRPIYERYRNNPVQTPESELVTEIFLPVRNKA